MSTNFYCPNVCFRSFLSWGQHAPRNLEACQIPWVLADYPSEKCNPKPMATIIDAKSTRYVPPTIWLAVSIMRTQNPKVHHVALLWWHRWHKFGVIPIWHMFSSYCWLCVCFWLRVHACMDAWMCICVCMHVCMHVCTYAHMHICTYLWIYGSMDLCIHVSMYLCIYVSIYDSMHVSVLVSMCMYAFMYACTSIFMYACV